MTDERDLLPSYLRRWRDRFGHTQASVAAALGIGQSQVAKWEKGVKQISMERLYELADLYGVPAYVLLQDPETVVVIPKPEKK